MEITVAAYFARRMKDGMSIQVKSYEVDIESYKDKTLEYMIEKEKLSPGIGSEVFCGTKATRKGFYFKPDVKVSKVLEFLKQPEEIHMTILF